MAELDHGGYEQAGGVLALQRVGFNQTRARGATSDSETSRLENLIAAPVYHLNQKKGN